MRVNSPRICDLRPLLGNPRDMHAFFFVCEQLARVEVPAEVVRWIKLGRMTALRKPDGGVRGIVAGNVIRRLTSRTIAQQLGPEVERFRAGSECIAHAGSLRVKPSMHSDVNRRHQCTLLDCEGHVGRFGEFAGGEQVLPNVRLFYGSRSECMWEDENGTTQIILQGEGGEQGDAMMPLLFAVGQHAALVAAQG